jgi:hypothetical protein
MPSAARLPASACAPSVARSSIRQSASGSSFGINRWPPDLAIIARPQGRGISSFDRCCRKTGFLKGIGRFAQTARRQAFVTGSSSEWERKAIGTLMTGAPVF